MRDRKLRIFPHGHPTRDHTVVRLSACRGRPGVVAAADARSNLTQCRPRSCHSWATGAQVEEQRYPLPAATAIRFDHTIRNPRFPQGLDEQAGFLERQKIALNRSM